MNNKSKIAAVSIDDSYYQFLYELKEKIQSSQIQAALKVNEELILLYWEIGKAIVEKQKIERWNARIIEKLCDDLQAFFPGIQGFSRTNIFRIRAFYLSYQKVPQPVGLIKDLPIVRIPWGHNVVLLEKIKNIDERLWYAEQVIQYGLSRNTLINWIKSKAFKRHGRSISNFSKSLPDTQSKLAQETLKDPYNFDFLTLKKDYFEKDLEQGLINNMQKFLLELGKGFAFIGNQYQIDVGGKDYYIDLLFYHVKLHCYCIVELKCTEFEPEHAGKINFYITAVDKLLKSENDNPTIGILLCQSKNNIVVEYALQDINKPIGISNYEIRRSELLPNTLKDSLPTSEELKSKLILSKLDEGGSKKMKKRRFSKMAEIDNDEI